MKQKWLFRTNLFIQWRSIESYKRLFKIFPHSFINRCIHQNVPCKMHALGLLFKFPDCSNILLISECSSRMFFLNVLLKISFSFTNIILLRVHILSYITQAGFRFLFFKRNKFLGKSLASPWNFLRKRSEGISFFSQYGTSIKVICFFLFQERQVVKSNNLPH